MKAKQTNSASTKNPPSSDRSGTGWISEMANRHLRIGWWGLFLFMALGLSLEVMHGLKLGFYLDVQNEIRHTMWTLAHAHETLLSLVNIAFALTLRSANLSNAPTFASISLIAGWILMPVGFFLGGIGHFGGDPGIGVFLVPAGAVFLMVAMFQAGRQFRIH